MRFSILVAIALAISLPFELALAADCVTKASHEIENGNAQAAARILKKGARDGDERCQFVLGMWLLSGTGVESDTESGIRWLSEAVKQGLPAAQANLGLLYASGWGVKRDEQQAAAWYRAAAEYGDPLGQTALGAATFLGLGVPADPVEGYKWTSLAAAQGNDKALVYLPAMEGAMTTEEVEEAKKRASTFRPKERSGQHRPSRRDALRAFGLHGPPNEYDRFFGY